VISTGTGGECCVSLHLSLLWFFLLEFFFMSLVKVTKSNYLVEASYNLSLQEQRLILACLSRVDPRSEIPKKVTISVSDYADMMQMDTKNAHRELRKAADKLYDRSIVVSDPEKTQEFRWIQSKAFYHKGEGKASFTWSDDVLVYISQLGRCFTSYQLTNVARFNSSYAIRLYELLMQFISTRDRKINLDDFKSLFNLSDKYPLFRDLNKWVIKPAVKEINKFSNLDVFYTTVKKGRCVVALQFDFQEKKMLQLGIS
jgi:plasmid replication initiation protein